MGINNHVQCNEKELNINESLTLYYPSIPSYIKSLFQCIGKKNEISIILKEIPESKILKCCLNDKNVNKEKPIISEANPSQDISTSAQSTIPQITQHQITPAKDLSESLKKFYSTFYPQKSFFKVPSPLPVGFSTEIKTRQNVTFPHIFINHLLIDGKEMKEKNKNLNNIDDFNSSYKISKSNNNNINKDCNSSMCKDKNLNNINNNLNISLCTRVRNKHIILSYYTPI